MARRAQLALDRYEDLNSLSLSLNRVRRDDLEAQVAQTQADLARLRAESASGVGGLESIINGLEQAERILVPGLADTLEALAVLEKAIALARARGDPPHPSILHLHIHVLEMSATPERAEDGASVAAFDSASGVSHIEKHRPVFATEVNEHRGILASAGVATRVVH